MPAKRTPFGSCNEEHVLGEVFSIFLITGKVAKQAKDRVVMRIQKHADRRVVARSDLVHEFNFVHPRDPLSIVRHNQ